MPFGAINVSFASYSFSSIAPKDILRSYCHELIHHVQNERGDLDKGNMSSPTYAQDDDHMRKMEMEAYLKGNLLLRDFEDNFKYE